jgi:hypothetical protein
MSIEKTTTPALHTSPVTGEIDCAENVPRRITDTWWRDRWRKVTACDYAGWLVAELGEMRCEVCKSIERNAAPVNAPSTRGTRSRSCGSPPTPTTRPRSLASIRSHALKDPAGPVASTGAGPAKRKGGRSPMSRIELSHVKTMHRIDSRAAFEKTEPTRRVQLTSRADRNPVHRTRND